MQYRMKTHQLPKEEINTLLKSRLTGTLSTIGSDGMPYGVPVHFVFLDGAIYFHGLPVGQKIDNLKTNPHVCFTVYEMKKLLLAPNKKPCDTNTSYVSVVMQGKAKLLDKQKDKKRILSAIVAKYTPQLVDRELPSNMIEGTAVVKIIIENITGKYYP